MACKNFYIIDSISVTETNVVLNITSTPTLANGQRFCFRIKDVIPDGGLALPVVVSINSVNYPVWNKYGNPITGSALRRCRVYKGYYGTTTAHIIISNYPCNLE